MTTFTRLQKHCKVQRVYVLHLKHAKNITHSKNSYEEVGGIAFVTPQAVTREIQVQVPSVPIFFQNLLPFGLAVSHCRALKYIHLK